MTHRTVTHEVVDVETTTGPLAVIRKRPEGDGYPGVVMFHDGPGIRSATHEFAARLASAGFDVVVPDLYRRHGRMVGYELAERKADPTLLDNLWRMLDSLDDQEIQDDLDAALSAVGFDQRPRLATIGFCVGARAAFRTLLRLPTQFVTGALWHPSYLVDETADSPHLGVERLRASLFVGIGQEDQMQPVEAHQPFLDALHPKTDVEVQIYPGADHGYTWPGWPGYDQTAAEHSFRQTVALFQRELNGAS